ncbi:MAG: FKBP-type peptidyl-prolyl cis-trans isomerase [Thermoplasmata archaeon]|uniref:peptidylprolyl isomerase n=1 Tax=Candidatus Sysuiplasma superficiale TaxID=2823368 RepID=A0A8J7YPC5_9ARCH|nr:FKBP-type peptidyl-prolyl cis-trans isomerase [Candidatus Sysuiplasma superficiale]
MSSSAGGSAGISRGGTMFIALLLIGAALVGYSGYQYIVSSKPVHQMTVQDGDSVLLNYTGQYTNGQVFDTSMYSVAINNGSYPKGPGFQWRGNQSNYKPLNVSDVGSGQVVQGMDQGIVGMAVNQTKTIVVPPQEGYGPLNASLLQYLPVYQNLTLVHSMNSTRFFNLYGQELHQGSTGTFTDAFWHWTDMILNDENGTVVYQYLPSEGQVVYPYSFNSTVEPGYSGWPVKVISVNSAANNGSGQVTLYNEISPSMIKALGGRNQTGSTFVLWSINSNGTVTLNYNRPVYGRTLIFTVTVTYINNPNTGKSAGVPSYAQASVLDPSRTRMYNFSILFTISSHMN